MAATSISDSEAQRELEPSRCRWGEYLCGFILDLVGLGLILSLLYLLVTDIVLAAQDPKLPHYQMESATVSESPTSNTLEWDITLLATNPNKNYRINYAESVGRLYYGDTKVGDAFYLPLHFTLKRRPDQKRFNLKFQVTRQWFQVFVASDLSNFKLSFLSEVNFRFWHLYAKNGPLGVSCSPDGSGFTPNNQTTIWTNPSNCIVEFTNTRGPFLFHFIS